MRPYVIWSPPWDHKVGGIRALYALRDGLRARGFDAWLHDEHRTHDAIVVYPEIVQGNPLAIGRVVRWRLNKADVPDDGLVYDWAPTGDGAPLLTFDLIDHEQLARREREGDPREGAVVFVVRKGVANPALIPPGAVEITRTWPSERRETIHRLASASVLISFDEFTLLNVEAVLLGTPVVLYPTGRWSRAEIEPMLPPGVCWHPDDIEQARKSTRDAWPWYLAEVAQYPERLDRFIEETQARWPSSG